VTNTSDLLEGLREVLVIVGSGLVIWAISTVREVLRRLDQHNSEVRERLARLEERVAKDRE